MLGWSSGCRTVGWLTVQGFRGSELLPADTSFLDDLTWGGRGCQRLLLTCRCVRNAWG